MNTSPRVANTSAELAEQLSSRIRSNRMDNYLEWCHSNPAYAILVTIVLLVRC
jgi:hypothetical protein